MCTYRSCSLSVGGGEDREFHLPVFDQELWVTVLHQLFKAFDVNDST